MTFQFKLQLNRVECLNEQVGEPGKDEIRLIGFGVTRKGKLFATGVRNLGSYGTGDVGQAPNVPLLLFDAELPSDGLEVLFYFWLVEADWGDVGSSGAALETEFRNSYSSNAQQLVDLKFPRECIPFTAFYKTVLPMDASIKSAARDLFNDDDVFAPVDLMFRYEPSGVAGLNSSGEMGAIRSKYLGVYNVTFRYSYHKIGVILG